MNVLLRIVSVAALLLSAGALTFTVVMMSRERKVRLAFDLTRLGLALVTVIVMTGFVGVGTPGMFIGLGLLIGFLLGVVQGLNLKVRLDGARVFARRNLWGIASWGAGIGFIQMSAALSTVGVLDAGLTISFFGIGQTSGLMTGRWQTVQEARRAAATTTLLLIVLLLLATLFGAWVAAPAEATEGLDIRSYYEDRAAHEGLTIEVHGSGLGYYGESLRISVANQTGAAVIIQIPVGVRFVPENTQVQTMIGAGGEVMTVEPGPPGAAPYSQTIIAFCGEKHDAAPSTDDVFTAAGDLASGGVMDTVQAINEDGNFGSDAQAAIWHWTDGLDIGANPVAQDLARRTSITPANGAKAALAGLFGSALLFGMALLEAGVSVAEVLAAFRESGIAGLRELADRAGDGGPSG